MVDELALSTFDFFNFVWRFIYMSISYVESPIHVV